MMIRPNLSPRALFAVLAPTLLVIAIIAGTIYGIELAVLCLAAGSLGLTLWMLWSSVRSLSSDTPLTLEEALALLAPSAAEEQKRSVLRALKDLEYERSLGKITEEDYREYSERYRAEARGLIATLDAQQAETRALAEKLVSEELAKTGGEGRRLEGSLETSASPKDEIVEKDSAKEQAARAAQVPEANSSATESSAVDNHPASALCVSCGTRNDSDARFCKQCGATIEKPSSVTPSKSLSEEEAP